jgi:hypothetical protein
MEHILEPDSSFDFSTLYFVSPTSLSGGNYFIRTLTSSQNPFYIQPPKCFLKQGILKSGKKLICDLVFQPHDEPFLEFLETLEVFCQNKIYNNREKWFEPGLSKVDIENCFASPCKTYNRGKFHSLRSNIPVRMGKCNLKIFDEREQHIPLEEMKENTTVMTILEIQGIRCSMRSFQLEFEIKQMMLIQPIENVFEKFMFSGKNLGKKIETLDNSENLDEGRSLENHSSSSTELSSETKAETDAVENDETSPIEFNISPIQEDVLGKEEILTQEPVRDVETLSDPIVIEPLEQNEIPENLEKEVEPENLEKMIIEDSKNSEEDDICEVTLDIPTDDDNVQEIKLRNPNEVYYEMYKEAKRKAQIARDLAISSYLTAKQIKHNYLSEENFSDDEDMIEEEKELKEMDLEKEDISS